MLESTRHESRERVVGLLYEADIKNVSLKEVVSELSLPLDVYAATLVDAVEASLATVDENIAEASDGWALDRLAALDLNILRVAVTELITQPDVPTAVIIDEAVEIAKSLSTDSSSSFVNGVLSTLAAKLRHDPRS